MEVFTVQITRKSNPFESSLLVILLALLLFACGGGGSSSTPTVTTPEVSLTSLSVNTTESGEVLKVSETFQMSITGTYSNGTTRNLTSLVTWSSSNSAITDVSSSGLVTALSAGSTTITAEYNGLTAATSITVIELIDLSISPSSITIPFRSSQQLTVTGIYTDNSSESFDGLVTWNSSNPEIANVSNTGEVLGISAGTATISASVNSIETSVVVTVSAASLQSITVSSTTTQIPVGLTSTFTAIGGYSDGTVQDLTNQVQWSVSDSSIASIDAETGILTALKTGTFSVIASKEGQTNSLSFLVSPASLTGIAITPSEISLAKGSKIAVAVTANFSDNTKVDVSEQVTWVVTDEQIVKIENDPLEITSLNEGTTTVTASLMDQEAELLINVTNAELASIEIYPVNSTIPLGQSQQFYAQGIFSDGSVQDLTSEVTWLSSNEELALISNAETLSGLAESISLGNTTLKATLGEIEQETLLTITNGQLNNIEVEPTTIILPEGSNEKVRALGYFSDGSIVDLTASVTWSSSNTSVLDLAFAKQGSLLSSNKGSALLSATLEGVVGLANVSVTDSSLQSIDISALQIALPKGMNQRLVATGTYSDLSTRDISHQVTWQSTDVHIATVANNDNAGLVQAVNPGTSTISASLENVSDEFTVNVTDVELTKIDLTIPKTQMNVLSTQLAKAIASFSDSSNLDVSSQVNWRSSDSNIAMIGNIAADKGLIKGLSAGSINILASLQDVSSSLIPLEVSLSPNLPRSLNLSAQPNIILNDNNDTASIELTLIPNAVSGVIADGTPISLTITEGTETREVNLVTTNGTVSYSLTSSYEGFISLSASSNEFSVDSGVLSTDDLTDVFSVSGRGNVVFENNTLKEGSVFYLLLRNLTNREFIIEQIDFGYLDPNNNNSFVNFPESPNSTDEYISNGDLTAGEAIFIGYQLDNDVEASVYVISYLFTDVQSNTSFRFGGTFDFSQ